MTTIKKLRAKLLAPALQQEERKKKWKVQGRYGEIIVKNKLLASGGLDVVEFPQNKSDKLDFTSKAGKRPDYVVCDIDGNKKADEYSAVCVDSKCHTVDDSKCFWISNEEMGQYEETLKLWEQKLLIFAVVPADNPTKMILIGNFEMADDSANNRKVFKLSNVADRSVKVHRTDHDLAIKQLKTENYDVALAPSYPSKK